MSLSVPEFVVLATTEVQVAPKSVDRATTVSLRWFCSHDAKTVRPSRESTTICASHWPLPGSAISRGAPQLWPPSAEVWRIIVGLGQLGQPGTPPYCG